MEIFFKITTRTLTYSLSFQWSNQRVQYLMIQVRSYRPFTQWSCKK